MNPLAERFGVNLRRCRRRVRLSQEEVALRASLHRTEVGKLERGTRLPRIDTLLKLMTAVEAPAADLLDGMDWTPARTGEGRFSV
jgi:transcriptional regulator with XRE-family HTH domain